MIYAVRASRSFPLTRFTSRLQQSQFRCKLSAVRFRPATAMASVQDNNKNMEKPNNPNDKTGDIMSDCFGVGYATRCDEEGFGGIYGGKQSFPQTETKDDPEKIHENHPEYDKTQGSEAKEKGRHKTDAGG